MPIIRTKDGFLEELKKYINFNSKSNICSEFESEIKVEERTEDGKGEIYLDISNKDKDVFFVKINHCQNHTIGTENNHNDGIVLKVNLNINEIAVYFFELKKNLRFNKLETASKQLANAYKLISYLQLEKCFNVSYTFCIAYDEDNLKIDADALKTSNRYNSQLFTSVYENKNTIPIMMAFCKYYEFNFIKIKFGKRIKI